MGSTKSYDPTRDIPNLSGKVIVVTGANAGIGYQTTAQLAVHGAKVYLACRTESKAREAIASLEAENPSLRGQGRLHFLLLELSSLQLSKSAAEEFIEKEQRLDVLVNNAGRLYDDYVLTKEGIERSIAVNHLGLAVFTNGLLPLLKNTAKEPGSDVRIVTVSSAAYQWAIKSPTFASLDDLNDYQGKMGSKGWWPKFTRYCTSKMMNLMWLSELQRRLDVEGVPITVIALHPGTVSTDALKQYSPWWLNVWISLTAIPPSSGAYTSLFAASSLQIAADRQKYKGAYLEPYGKIVKPVRKEVHDKALAGTLWETTERIVNEVLAVPIRPRPSSSIRM
ncbi:NAD-P-binding protein [Artomyces pyxidatus]|uniref:NAD-P-binding protein n=1 Tax=Artomyces pyxidatus TaxID=48021 RepID=A0ACB8SZE5_9AGAM|nr:NAD-P-binding protein [Artomyces pyxidatus]